MPVSDVRVLDDDLVAFSRDLFRNGVYVLPCGGGVISEPRRAIQTLKSRYGEEGLRQRCVRLMDWHSALHTEERILPEGVLGTAIDMLYHLANAQTLQELAAIHRRHSVAGDRIGLGSNGGRPSAVEFLVVGICRQLRLPLPEGVSPIDDRDVEQYFEVQSANGPIEPQAEPAAAAGHKVDVGGYGLFYRSSGTGTPAVVVEAGLGEAGASKGSWESVIEEVQKTTRILVYDRAGLEKSDKAPVPRTSKDIVKDLHTLLDKAEIPGPYILVGHSVSGFSVRVYASEYPRDVVGIVLVDSSHPDQYSRMHDALPDPSPSELPKITKLREAFANAHVQSTEGIVKTECAKQAVEAGSLGDKRLIVLTAGTSSWSEFPPGVNAKLFQTWQSLQHDLASLSTRSTQTIAKKSGHYIQKDEPEVVVEAIRIIRRP